MTFTRPMDAASLEQCLGALRLANRVRTRRAIAKIVLANSGNRLTSYPELVAILANPPAELAGERIDKVLRAAPGVGTTRVASSLRRAGVRASIAIDRISSRQRGLISDALTPTGKTVPCRPLVAAGITGALASTEMPASVIAHWFHTSRSELAGRTPKEVLVKGHPGDAQIVLDLARSDAAALLGARLPGEALMAEYEPRGPVPARLHNIAVNSAIRAETDRERAFAERHQRMLEHEQRLQASPGGQRFLEKIRGL